MKKVHSPVVSKKWEPFKLMNVLWVDEAVMSLEINGSAINKTWQQLHYLYIHLNRQFPEIWVPAVPDAPKYSDDDYMSKKKRQVERYLSKLSSSTTVVECPMYKEFLKGDLPIPAPVKGKSWFTTYDNGFLSATFPNNLPIDAADIKKRKQWILHQQQLLEEMRDNVKDFVTYRMIYSESIKKLNDCKFEYLADESTIEHETLLQEMVDLIAQRSLKHYAIEFGDTVQEYLKHLDELKIVINHEIRSLVDYDTKRQQFKKKKKLVDQHVTKEGHEFDFLKAELEEIEKLLAESETELIRINEVIENEFSRFEMHRVTDFSDCFDSLAALEKEENSKVLTGLQGMTNKI